MPSVGADEGIALKNS